MLGTLFAWKAGSLVLPRNRSLIELVLDLVLVLEICQPGANDSVVDYPADPLIGKITTGGLVSGEHP
jgi:hypothetical protein